jgi:hypothetical protein
MLPLPLPEGVTVHHDWLLEAVHAELEVTVKEVVPAAADTGWSEGVTESVGEPLGSHPLRVFPEMFVGSNQSFSRVAEVVP